MSDESEHSESEFYYPEELTDMELLQLPTDVQREDKKSSAKLLIGEEFKILLEANKKETLSKKQHMT